MVDLENLSIVSNSGRFPNLLNNTDIDNIRQIVDAHPDLFNGSNKIDNGGALFKTLKSDGSTEPTKYGFRFSIPTGLTQYQFWDGTISDNKLYQYLAGEKGLYFEAGKPDAPVEEHIAFEPIPLFKPTIEALCQLATEYTGNTDTTSLSDFLSLLDNILTTVTDYQISYMVINRSNKSFKIGLDKTSDSVVSDDLFTAMGTRSNTKVYQSCQSVSGMVDKVIADPHSKVDLLIEFNSTGLVKEMGYAMTVVRKKGAPKGTSPQDNIGLFNERVASHNSSIELIAFNAKYFDWLPDSWVDEISQWETASNIEAIYGATVLTAEKEGTRTQLQYGFDGPIDGTQY